MPPLTKGPSTVGMMDGAFFVGRVELLSWANDVLQLNLTKVEQCANGGVYCSVIDACHPGRVNMKKVNWTARNDPEIISNYKVLQQAFDKCGIDRHVEVDKLIRGKYQDNLEMLQWIKCYFENTYAGDGAYDAEGRRTHMQQLPDWARQGSPGGGGAGMGKENVQPPRLSVGAGKTGAEPRQASKQQRRSLPQEVPANAHPSTGPGPARSARNTPAAVSPQLRGGNGNGNGNGVRVSSTAMMDQLREENRLQKEEITDLKISVDGLESERDYYFGKLRDIEILTQTLEERGFEGMTVTRLIQDVQSILHQKEDENEDDAVGAAGGDPTNRGAQDVYA